MVRRSARARQSPKSSYDEELQHLAEKKNQSQDDSDSELRDVVKEVKEAMMEEDRDEDMDDMEEEEEEFSPKKVKAASPRKTSKSKPPQRAVQVKAKASSNKTNKSGKKGGSKNKRSVQGALGALAKKVLDPSETPETALVAALLASAKPIPGMESSSSTARVSAFASHTPTMYTPQLDAIARRLLQEHEPNSMHIQLLNLLFRSVGGSVETNLKDGTDLEDLNDNEWDNLVTEVVQVMRESDTELLTAVPDDKMGPREYRAIYQEFWYRLGTVILSHTPGAGADDEDDPLSSKKFTSDRFQVELMRELVSRVTELVLVGQPDLRAAATTAVWELAKASMERTVELTAKLDTAQRQYAASKGQSRKMQALEHSMDTWKRHKAELEVVVEESVIQGVFSHRYRDSNAHIRKESLEALRQLILLRPDMFLKDKYLKYLGWMTSDKDACVRLAALKGLLAPFKYKQEKRPASLQFELQSMQNVCTKFLPRIAECTDDAHSLEVQEAAMELVFKLTNEGFMDDWHDDEGWDKLNLKAIDTDSSPSVRKNALYLILDQIDCFDDGGVNDSRSVASAATLSERQQIVRIDALARWIAHPLTDGPVEVDKIKIELTDHIVHSLREMPEHKSLTTSWTAMLKAIRSENPQQGRQEKEEVAKTGILLRILACAAKLEVGQEAEENSKRRKRDSATSNQTREALSQALLKTLPGLLTSFKTDQMSMRSLTKLPQYLLPEIYSLPTRKSDFSSLVKNLCVAFLESTDEESLLEISNSLSIFVQGDHARVSDVKAQLKRVSTALQDRLMELFAESDPDKETSSTPNKGKRKRSSRRSDASSSMDSDGVFSNSKEADIEHSICLCLTRWRILLKKVPLSFLFDESEEDDENEVEGFCKTITEALGKRLVDRKPTIDDEADEGQTVGSRSAAIASVWKSEDLAIHSEVSHAIDTGLDVLLCIVSWKLADTTKSKQENAQLGVVDEDEDDAAGDLLVVRLRDGLSKLLGLCYEQFLEDLPGLVYSDEQADFSAAVQTSAGRVGSDLRTMFPREWSLAKDPTLRALALQDDSHLIGGFVRYLQSRGEDFEETDAGSKEEVALVKELLQPVARALTANWTNGNRKEAGVILSHLTGSGKLAGSTVHGMARLLKKIHPVRFLESQMAALRMAFKSWLDGEPEELSSDRPSEEQMQQYEQAEKEHQALFHAAEHLASRLSMSLGVGKINDARLSQALLNFMQEGIRFAFEGDPSLEDDLVLGSRLPFLLVLGKYSSWIKRNKNHRELLADILFSKEATLRAHPEFDEVHEDDLRCVSEFQDTLGIAAPKRRRVSPERAQDESVGRASIRSAGTGTPGSGAASAGSRRPMSAAGSQRSRFSVQSNLSPLLESPEDRPESPFGEEDSPSPQKRTRLSSSLPEPNESRIDEEASESDESVF